ncbi:MAG: hypothetical protein JW733_04945 [Coriobacteriia bacterium]|nr:hypothetical protein [Coriobacteriia bacterium]MBN2847780.1 hypothetical protein [Coriobacteriia bacterium]
MGAGSQRRGARDALPTAEQVLTLTTGLVTEAAFAVGLMAACSIVIVLVLLAGG